MTIFTYNLGMFAIATYLSGGGAVLQLQHLGDQVPLYLRGASPYPEQAGDPVDPFHGQLLHITHAAVNLQDAVGDPVAHLRSEQFRHGDLLDGHVSLID